MTENKVINKLRVVFRKIAGGYKLFFILILTFFSCSKSTPSFKINKDTNGIYFNLIAIGDGEKKPNLNSILQLEIELKTLADSAFFNSKNNTRNGLFIDLKKTLIEKYFNSYFLQLSEGDSVAFLSPPTLFFKTFFDTAVPFFCLKDSLIQFNMKVISILNKTQYETLIQESETEEKTSELKKITDFISSHYPHVTPQPNGIYQLEKIETKNEQVKIGNKITISYQGFYLDEKPLDVKPQKLEFIYGTPDQIIKGLNIVIGTLKKGEFSKIIVPSQLAFGEKGSSNQLVQPFTPLVYNITLIDIK
jgi:FKBP-type peptidyl-prolyl cis-trans isomerase